MQALDNIKKKVIEMSKLALRMWQATNQAFMEHDLGLLSKVLEEENKLNNLEKEITSDLIELSRLTSNQAERARAIVYADIAGDLELIGDYCKDILERVQIKIEEKLLFSDDAVKEYEDLYHKTEEALNEATCVLERPNLTLGESALKDTEYLDGLVDEYRARHNQRLIDGICSPLACNMFLNMLDFTAAVYRHAKKIAKGLVKIKE